MTTSTVAVRGVRPTGRERLDREEIFEILSNRRRRYALHYLKWHGGETSLRDVAQHVAAWENETECERLDYSELKRVQNALHQFHLPKMADQGFVNYDPRQAMVSLSEQAKQTDFYVDILPPWHIPWGLYYMLLSVLSLLIVGSSAIGLPGVSSIAPLTWFFVMVLALTLSSIGQFYDNYYRMRLGALERPPEVR